MTPTGVHESQCFGNVPFTVQDAPYVDELDAFHLEGDVGIATKRPARQSFEAVPAARIPKELTAFLDWFNRKADMDEVLHAALAHFWFVTIHPFDDGNGRVARAVADMDLARSEKSEQRFYSMSTQLRQEGDHYYEALETAQKGSMDVTAWMEWFLGCLGRAIDGASVTLSDVLTKARFWESVRGTTVSDRQTLVLNRLLDGFEGKPTTSKYAKRAKCSTDTAPRDIQALVERGVLAQGKEKGRSTSYALKAEAALDFWYHRL